MTESVVLKLVRPICGHGHHLYCDNLYTSPSLFLQLRSRGFHACGTLRLNRRGVLLEAKMNLKKGELRVIPLNDIMKVVHWHDKRVVSIVSNIHSDATVLIERRSRHVEGGREVVEKLEGITEYNKYMGGVDRPTSVLLWFPTPNGEVVEEDILLRTCLMKL